MTAISPSSFTSPRSPVRPSVAAACELLGIDPLYVANEGKLVAVVAPQEAAAALEALTSHRLGRDASPIGEVRREPPGLVVLVTAFGGTRIVDMLVGDPLPRILLNLACGHSQRGWVFGW